VKIRVIRVGFTTFVLHSKKIKAVKIHLPIILSKRFFTKQLIVLLTLLSCNETPTPKKTMDATQQLHQLHQKLTDIIITDIFPPPVASRIYVYTFLAAYEAGKFTQPNAPSIAASLKDFDAMPVPETGKTYDFQLASIKAFCAVAPKVIFSTQEMAQFEQKNLSEWQKMLSDSVFNRSIAFGEKVAAVIIKRLSNDNYRETRGMERYEVKNNATGRWVPTPPDYADAVEPHWVKMKTFCLDSASQFRPVPPPAYELQKGSLFQKETQEVYDLSKSLTDKQMDMISFWDDNPFVSKHKGHLMFQDKKMTPGGHWLAICQLLLKQQKVDYYPTLRTYTLTAIGIYEAFLSCWEAKYHYARLRPETVISETIEKQWHPYLVTPPFPAYTSGHSTISAAAATILTNVFGDNQFFTDTTEVRYNLPIRSFKSFQEAALEASESRILAGIHFRSDCVNGHQQGKKVGDWVLSKLKTAQ
jgi:PAP2 superfamily